ncbi:MAG: hypothetical protein AUK47_21080 [Deltaproteobacteria bacterium CG2_30_63_29]|nr:MAG: hypothetical protein AUK47_21080 [Deltaproteobacteria bacterium CG2_30_63_29]PJB36219.1 MAG: hypothetical protein CO108_23920 [Deltaproteobacteria bacterium CG_4_9_14_3_um_filter_63_12]
MDGQSTFKTLFFALLLALGMTSSACDDGAGTKSEGIDVTPRVTVFGLDVDAREGFAPHEAQFTVRFTTDDPRARVTAYIDFGDGTTDEWETQTALPGDPNPQNTELETTPEDRAAHFTHLYEDPGTFTVTVWAVDVSNSKPATETEPAVEIKSAEQNLDITVSELPDLIAVAVSADKTAIEIDETFDISFQVLNDGTDIDRPFDVELYLVKRSNLTIDELIDSAVAVKITVVRSSSGSLNRNESLNDTVTVQICDFRLQQNECDKLQAQVSHGEWFPALWIDPPNVGRPELNIQESDETNNFRVSSTGMSIAPAVSLPDLTPQSIVANPVSTDILRQVNVSFEVTNIGEGAGGPSSYTIFLSEGDQTLDPTDLELGTGNLQPLPAGEYHIVTNLAYTLPQEIKTPGLHYILVAVSTTDDEVTRTNNIRPSDRPITVNGEQVPDVDLAATALTVSPEQTYVGAQIHVEFTANNNGADDSGTYKCGIYISESSTFDLATATLLVLVGSENLLAGTNEAWTRDILLLPAFVTPGDRYVFATCDPQDTVAEIDETNNIAGPSNTIVVNAEPQIDFTVRNLVVSPSSLAENEMLYFTADICNLSTDYAGQIAVKAVLSADDVIQTTDALVVTANTLSTQLAPNACESIALSGKVNCLPFVDTYTAGLIVDPTDAVLETDETNNVAASTGIITLTGGTGSLCTCVEDASEGTGNNDIATATPITLTGTNPKVASITDLSLCDSTDFYAVDLDRGDTITLTLNSDPALGDLDLRLYDDADTNSPFESVTTTRTEVITHKFIGLTTSTLFIEVFPKQGGARNYYTLDISVTPSPTEPDLIVQSITLVGGTSVSARDPYNFEVTVRNDGLFDAPTFDLAVFFSTNATLDVNDTTVGTVNLTGLASFATQTEPFVYDFPTGTPTGNYYLIAVVDPLLAVTEVNETNNTLVSSRITIDADCLPDALEGLNGNDTFANAYVLRPGLELISYDNLNICNAGRGDYYFVCVPGTAPLNNIGVVQRSPTYASEMEVTVYDRDQLELDNYASSYDALISVAVPANTCTANTDCPSAETCVANQCEDTAGEHCVYVSATFYQYATAVTRTYSLSIDNVPADQFGEPNDVRTAPTPFSPSTQVLAAGSGHTYPEDDDDWYSIAVKAGTTFTANIHSADADIHMGVYVGASTSANYLYPEIPEAVTITSDAIFYMHVYKYSYGLEDRTTAYQIQLIGLEGIDLVPRNLATDVDNVSDSILISWDLANQRLTDTGTGVDYDYVLSQDQVIDSGDYWLGSGSTAGPDAFTSISVQDKVYLSAVPPSVFGDYYVVVDVDPANLITEADENNNRANKLIYLELVCVDDLYESTPNDTRLTATPITVPPMSSFEALGLTTCTYDVDFFELVMPAGATYEFVIQNMVPFAAGDIDLLLLSDTGAILDRSDGLATTSELIVYTNADGADKTVYLEVKPFRSTFTNIYDLVITEL